MIFNWQRDPGEYANGDHVKVGRIGRLHVWYDGLRATAEPRAYAASIFDIRCPKRFETAGAAKAWCEKWGERFLHEAAADVGCELINRQSMGTTPPPADTGAQDV